MSGLVSLLGVIAILITAVGAYRFSVYFFGAGGFPILIAAGATVSFLILFEYIILIMGLALIGLPIGFALRQADLLPSGTSSISQSIENRAVKGGTKKGAGELNPYPNHGTIVCNQCNQGYAGTTEELPDYCGECGNKLN